MKVGEGTDPDSKGLRLVGRGRHDVRVSDGMEPVFSRTLIVIRVIHVITKIYHRRLN